MQTMSDIRLNITQTHGKQQLKTDIKDFIHMNWFGVGIKYGF